MNREQTTVASSPQCVFTKQEREEWSQSSPSTPSDVSSPHSLEDVKETGSDYNVYHVPRGYDVLLVPKTDEPTTPEATSPLPALGQSPMVVPSDAPSESELPSKPMDIPKSAKQPQSPPQSQQQQQEQQQQQQQQSPTSPDTPTATPTTPNTTTPPTRLSAYRKRKADKNYIPRPKNCFMAYREHIKEKFLTENPTMNNKVVSVLAANMWNGEPEDVKEYWRERARQLKAEHKQKYPDYKFKPQKKKQNLKTANGQTKPAGKTSSRSKKVAAAAAANAATTNGASDPSKIVFTDGFGGELVAEHPYSQMVSVDGPTGEEQEEVPVPLHKKPFFGHYRASSVDSVSSWTSDSTASTPLLSPFVGSPASYSPPTFLCNNQLGRSPSALRFESASFSSSDEGSLVLSPNQLSQHHQNHHHHNHHHHHQFMGEVDQLGQMYGQLDVNATVPVDDGFSLDDSSPTHSPYSMPAAASDGHGATLLQQPLVESPSATDLDLMAMGGQYGGSVEEGEGYFASHPYHNDSVDTFPMFNEGATHETTAGAAPSIAEHYLGLEAPRRNSQQMLNDYEEGMRQHQLLLQSLLA